MTKETWKSPTFTSDIIWNSGEAQSLKLERLEKPSSEQLDIQTYLNSVVISLMNVHFHLDEIINRYRQGVKVKNPIVRGIKTGINIVVGVHSIFIEVKVNFLVQLPISRFLPGFAGIDETAWETEIAVVPC